MPYPKHLRTLALGLAAVVLATPAFAQATDEQESAAELKPPPGFVLPPRLRQVAFREANPWTFHFNARYNTGKPSIEFGGMGEVTSNHVLPGADQTDVTVREYDDGGVLLDGPRENEIDANGNQTSTPGGRYEAPVPNSDDDSLYLDLLSYTPGQTRYWRYLDDSQQVGASGIAMHAYSAQSAGASYATEHDGSAIGFEMAVARRIMNLGPKTEIGFNASFGLTDVTAEHSDTVTADLVTLTDTYQIFGAFPSETPYQAPLYDALYDDIGNIIIDNGVEITTPLQQITADRTVTVTPGGATVDSYYKVKGAYYSIRLGPEIRSHLSEKLAVMAGFGFVGAYVGSDFSVTESLDVSNLTVLNNISYSASQEYKDFVAGFYGELSVEYWLTPRTAFFVGGVYESLDEFVQSIGGRTATIVLGNNLIVRVGFITRF